MKRFALPMIPLMLAAAPALAQPSLGEILPNIAGGGVGFQQEYLGSSRSTFGAAPMGRVSLGGERFVALTGPFLETNLVDSTWLQAGPVANIRLGRSGAHDRAVRALGDLDWALELGGRVGVSYLNTQGIPFRARAGLAVVGDATGSFGGVQVIPSASLWVPLSPTLFVGAGVTARIGSGGQNNHYFGVSQAGSAASGLPAFRPGGGLTHVTAWPAVLWRVSDSWAIGGGFAYTRLGDTVADSPIVRRGSRDNFVGGIGVAYTW